MSLAKEISRSIELLKKHRNDEIKIISHLDADGISSAAIISKTLDREGIEHKVSITKLNKIADNIDNSELTIFTDLGSGQLPVLREVMEKDYIIIDHHIPQGERT